MTTTTLDRCPASDISTAVRHLITVREAADRRGRFEIELADGSKLPASRTPLLSAARFLIGEGANPDAVIEMRHASKPGMIGMSGRIGTVAKIGVHEGPNVPRFRRWTPPPSAKAG